MKKIIEANLVNPIQRRIYPAQLIIENGRIVSITEISKAQNFILPGFVDSHIHIESSMLTPNEFSKVAAKYGTVAVVSDPHEIANVCGIDGINFMINDAQKAAIKFFFGAPSCVPATPFETSGAIIDANDVEKLMNRSDIYFLAEMMNYPGVINNDDEVLKKISHAKKYHKPIDGHGPGLIASDLKKYISAGISTDHETINLEEAEEKILNGMTIQIRNGSASKTFDDLFYIIDKYPNKVMLCSDDLHPADLLNGHINKIVKSAIAKGLDIFNVLLAASINPILHYKLNIGMLNVDDPADFIIVDNLENLNIQSNYVQGIEIYNAHNQIFLHNTTYSTPINNSRECRLNEHDLIVENQLHKQIRIIQIIENSILTSQIKRLPLLENNLVMADCKNDILKIVVFNRYENKKPAIGFINGFGIKSGAVASSIAHDSHNIIAIGTSDKEIANAINKVLELKGGIVFCKDQNIVSLPLPIAGLMSDKSAEEVAYLHQSIENEIHNAGSSLHSPLMSMSFLALPVIPALKITDMGLFDVTSFKFESLFVD